MKYLFISYSVADSIQAHSVAQNLEQRGYSVWLFENSGKCGLHHRKQTEDEIDNCAAFILLITKNSVFSDEVTIEVSRAHKMHKPIFPVLHKIEWARAMGANEVFRSILEGKRTAITIDETDFSRTISAVVKGLELEGINPPSPVIEYPTLINITPPEQNFVGRTKFLETITEWYNDPQIHIGALVGLGGEGKSSIARKWYDSMKENNIKPDGIFWYGFYRNAYLDRFLDSLLEFLANNRVDLTEIKSTWAKVDKINELIQKGAYLIILDGVEEMQKGKGCNEEFGCMHQELTEILRFWAEAKDNGLCLITSRYPLKDIANYERRSYQNLNIGRLSIEDGRLLFEKIGVKGDQKDIDKAINKYEGHALSLTIIANSLVDYFKGDITKVEEIPPIYEGLEAGGKARLILEWYVKQLSDEQLAFLKIFSLFQEEVTESDFEGVFRSKMDTAINKSLISMKSYLFKVMVKNLSSKCLISVIPKGQNNTYTTHPLIKGYFKSITGKDDYKACHKKIYECIGRCVNSTPETLEEMLPLFEQVYHGCQAELYDEVFDVYENKVMRKDDYYLVYTLGAWKSNLSLVSNFFEGSDPNKKPMVKERADQRYLLTSAGLSLFAIGETFEAEGLFRKAITIDIEDKEWKNASIDYEDLTALQFRIGKLKEAQDTVENSIEIANKLTGKDKQYVAILKAWLGYILFAQGKIERSNELFEEANRIYEELGPDVGGLYGIFWEGYARFLIRTGNVKDAFIKNERNLKLFTDKNKPAHKSRCYRSLGVLERMNGRYDESEEHLNTSLKIVREIIIQFLEIDVLIELGMLNLETKKYKIAASYLEEALELVNRTGFKLYEPDAEVVLAKVYLASGKIDKAKELANSASEKAKRMNYYWPQKDAEELLNFRNTL